MERATDRRIGTLKCAGAFSAWIIGSGFATGREIVEFFTRYGRWGWLGVIMVWTGLLLLGGAAVLAGYSHREEQNFNHFRYFCGPVLGAVYSRLTPAAVGLFLPVLLSGGGTAIYEEWGVDRRMGTVCLAVLVIAVWLAGFERLTAIAAWLAPVVIMFALTVGALTILRREDVPLREPKGTGWGRSGLLYLAMNGWGASRYHCGLGEKVRSRAAGAGGAALGATALAGAAALLCGALLDDPAASLAVPTLHLAERLHPFLGKCFFWVLLMGIFTSCSAMMWTVCPRKTGAGRGAAVMVAALLLGLFPFQKLMGSLYPVLGWLGVPYVLCVCRKILAGEGKRS